MAVGDVLGKGVPAALFGAFVSGSIRARAMERRAPGDLMTRVNRTLRKRGAEGFYCTVAFAVFDFPQRRMVLANSGLPYPLVYRAAEDRVETIELAGLPLGTFDERDLRGARGASGRRRRRRLLLGRADGSRDGERRLRHRAAGRAARGRGASGTAAELGERILSDVDTFLGQDGRARTTSR